MIAETSTEIVTRLQEARNIWFASVRPDGRPHLTPVWFVWHEAALYVCIDPEGVKGRNIQTNPRVALALEDGAHPVICEGTAGSVPQPWPPEVVAQFQHKYEWNITTDTKYRLLVKVTPQKWLSW
ncbi:MAG: pyridoxamine 5'-phosphate oxidase [Chloroflexi bacterium]|nr:pyridoxamine 5'-phosphate oxidase [Chloroflexota bacterium]